MPLPRSPRSLAALGAAAALVVAPVVTAAPALAHDRLVSSVPGADTTVANAPEAVSLGFSDAPLELGLQVVVTAPDGTVVSDEAPVVTGTDVVQGLADERPAGTYTVDWRVTSGDGHPIEGSYTFAAEAAVGAAPSASPSTSSPSTSSPSTSSPTTAASSSAAPSPSATDTAAPASATTDGGGGVSGPTWAWTAAAAVAGAALGTVLVRARRRERG